MPPRRKKDNPRPTASNLPPVPPAWRSPGTVALFLLLTALATTADLVTKELAFDSLLNDPQLEALVGTHRGRDMNNRQMLSVLAHRGEILPGVHVTLSTNPGVVFGLPMPRWAVATATCATLVLVGAFFATSPRRAWPLHVSMGLILAGALGNLYDRLFSQVRLPGFDAIQYEVRDFIDCSRVPLPFGFRYRWIFNVADVWLVLGVAVLALYWLVARPGRPAKQPKPAANPK